MDRGAPDTQFSVHHRGVVEDEVLLPLGGTVVVYEKHVLPDQFCGQLLRVGDGGRGEDEDGLGAVPVADAPQPADHVGQMAAEHPAVLVNLVYDHVLEVLEELHPLRVVGQDAGM